MRLTKTHEAELIAQLRDPARQDEHITFERDQYEQSGDILITRDGLRYFLHRYLWLQVIDPDLRRGLYLLRACGAWGCVNPRHRQLEAATRPGDTPRPSRAVGGDDAVVVNARKTHCPKNHPYSPENTYVWVDKDGATHRKCVICTKARRKLQSERERRARNQGA